MSPSLPLPPRDTLFSLSFPRGLDDAVAWGGRLTLLTLLLAPVGDWTVRPWTLTLAAAGLLLRAERQFGLWAALAALTLWRVVADWPLADNHAYLLGYWCLALAVATGLSEPQTAAANARWLIGLCFALAALQKWLSPDFANGVFFTTTLVGDGRFADFVVLFSNTSYADLDAARAYFEGDYRYQDPGPAPNLPPSLLLLATLSTWWNLLDQTLVAAAFLAPASSWLGRCRDPLLLIFCLVTYAVAPVYGFGWLLLAMGFSQSAPLASVRFGYLAVFALLIVYEQVPWVGLLLDWREAS